MLNLGITRDEKNLASLIQKAHIKNINIVPLPVTEIKSLLTDVNQIPKLDKINWLFFSSANGVHTFFANFKRELLPSSIKIAVVGKKTAEAVYNYQLDIHFSPSDAYGKNLFEEFKEIYNTISLQILYIRSESVNFEPKQLFNNSEINYCELITYKSVQHTVDKSVNDKLTDSDYILFTAPTTVDSYKNQFGSPKAKLIAIGRTTKDAIEQNNWKADIVLHKPEIESVLEYI